MSGREGKREPKSRRVRRIFYAAAAAAAIALAVFMTKGTVSESSGRRDTEASGMTGSDTTEAAGDAASSAAEETETSAPQPVVIYATYRSTPDTTWKAGETEQDIILSLPAEVEYTDTDGTRKTAENPLTASPSVWVDMDKDGAFTDDECVFNYPAYDDDGTLADSVIVLMPGEEITHITLTRVPDAGTYAAKTLWTPQIMGSGTASNPMQFDWNLTVE